MLDRFSLKFKILLIIIPMGIVLFILSAMVTQHYYKQVKELDGLTQIAESFIDYGHLVDDLQMEANKTIQLLQKKITKEELLAHRKDKTDVSRAAISNILEKIKYIQKTRITVRATLEEIDSIRKLMDNNKLEEADVIEAYSNLSTNLYVAQGQSAGLYSAKGIEAKLINIMVVQEVKEALVNTRFLYTKLYSDNVGVAQSDYSRLELVYGRINTLSNSSSASLIPEMHFELSKILNSKEWNKIIGNIEATVEKSAKGSFGIDGAAFNLEMNNVIEKFNELLLKEREGILGQAKEELNQANKILYTVVVLVVVIFIILIALAIVILRDLIKKAAEEQALSFSAARSAALVANSSNPTMMSDPQGTLLYMNKASLDNLKKLEQYLPEKVENLIGKSIDIFHKNPELQKRIISDHKNLPHNAVISIGPEKIRLEISAIISPEGTYIGVGVLWELVTDRLTLINDLTKASDDLSGAASNVLLISSNLSAAAEETSAQANTASVASEEVNAGVQTVASNMSEMVSAIKEITKTTNEAASMTNEAMRLANNTNNIINKLGDSSMDIGNVIKVISSIAQQTNLLALNATIEAARAGEAGKGFAVVANEVKELANQTAKATYEITKKIETIQGDSQSAISAIGEITVAIEKVNGFTSNIAAAVEEQAATTNEVTRIVTESAEGVKQISENISQVSSAAASTGKDAGSAQVAAKGVGETADLLKKYVNQLKQN